MEKNIIIHGDCITELKKIKDNTFDLIFADPPYWMRVDGVLNRVSGKKYEGVDDHWDKFDSDMDYNEFTRMWLKECKRVLKKNGSFWVIGGMQCIYTIGGIMQELGFWFINDVIWNKKNPTPNFMGTRLNNAHETLIWATKDKKSKYTFNYKTAKELNTDTVSANEFGNGIRKQLRSVWNISLSTGNERIKDIDGNKLHSTQKPEELLYRIIAISSNYGDLVMDPFGGTMTTAAVAKKMGRDYFTIEKEEKYVEYGRRRLEQILPEIGDIEKAKFDIRPVKAAMVDMISAGFFKVGEIFFTKDGYEYGYLNSDGKIIHDNEIYDMHTLGALAKKVKAKRINGFDFWKVNRKGKLVNIKDIREEYRSFVEKI